MNYWTMDLMLNNNLCSHRKKCINSSNNNNSSNNYRKNKVIPLISLWIALLIFQTEFQKKLVKMLM